MSGHIFRHVSDMSSDTSMSRQNCQRRHPTNPTKVPDGDPQPPPSGISIVASSPTANLRRYSLFFTTNWMTFFIVSIDEAYGLPLDAFALDLSSIMRWISPERLTEGGLLLFPAGSKGWMLSCSCQSGRCGGGGKGEDDRVCINCYG